MPVYMFQYFIAFSPSYTHIHRYIQHTALVACPSVFSPCLYLSVSLILFLSISLSVLCISRFFSLSLCRCVSACLLSLPSPPLLSVSVSLGLSLSTYIWTDRRWALVLKPRLDRFRIHKHINGLTKLLCEYTRGI